MTAGTWGETNPPEYNPARMMRRWHDHYPAYEPPRWWYQAEAARLAAEQRADVAERDLARMTTPNGVRVQASPLLMAAMKEVKPLPWKWIAFGALVAGLALWSWLA